jgi:hypothetical protein
MMKQSRTRLIDVFRTLAEEVHSIFTALIESSVAEDMGSLKFENTGLLDFRAVTPLAPAVRAAAVSAGRHSAADLGEDNARASLRQL